jgi:hypothetical protein
MTRRLRIAVSVFFALLCVVILAFWVRSYQKDDFVYNRDNMDRFATLGSNSGTVYFYRSTLPGYSYFQLREWTYGSVDATQPQAVFTWQSPLYGPERIVLPHWLPALLAATSATMPWLRWRYSLRMLLIAVTLVAVLLGLGIWLTS